MVLKKYPLLLIFVLAAITVSAQVGNYNYVKYAVGYEFSSTRGYTNVNAQNDEIAQSLHLTYYYAPFVPLEAEVQVGQLAGGGVKIDPYGRQYANNYYAVIFHADLQFGQIVNYGNSDFLNFIKDFYIGAGVGALTNNVKVQRTSPYDPSYVFPGTDHGTNIDLPFRIGYEYKFFNRFDEATFRIYVSYTQSFVLGEGLDGYNDPPTHFKNNATDQYRQISIGFKYDFGPGTSYTKIQ